MSLSWFSNNIDFGTEHLLMIILEVIWLDKQYSKPKLNLS